MGIDTPVAPRRTARSRVKWIVVVLAAAFLLGIAVTLQVRNWYALSVEAGGSCGSGRRGISSGPCPRGLTPMLLISFFALFALVPLGLFAFARSARIGRLAAPVALLLGIYPGMAIFNWWHGETLETAWQAPGEESTRSERADGSWLSGSTVVRARFDGLTAYDVAGGRQRWRYELPGQTVLCAVSRTAETGVGLIGFADEHKPCAQLAAVDLATGRALWQKTLTGENPFGGLPTSTTPDFLGIAGAAAVVKAPDGIQAIALRTGEPLWTHKVPNRCEFAKVYGAADRVATIVRCVDDSSVRLRMLDVASGKQRWEMPLPDGTNAYTTDLVSVAPTVVSLQDGGKRGRDTLLVLDDQGRTRATIDAEELDAGTHGFTAAPLRRLFVRGETLVAITRPLSRGYEMVGYRLADGQKAWTRKLGRHSINAIQAEGDQILVVTTSGTRPELARISTADGRQRGDTQLLEVSRLATNVALYVTPDRYVFVGEDGRAPFYRPLAAVVRK